MTGGKGIDVGFMAHPSFVEEDEIKALTGPLSIAAAGMLSCPSVQICERAVNCKTVSRNRPDLPGREAKSH